MKALTLGYLVWTVFALGLDISLGASWGWLLLQALFILLAMYWFNLIWFKRRSIW